MHRELLLTRNPIDEAALGRSRRTILDAGAALVFVGMVRDQEGSEPIRALDYEAFEAMADHQFQRLFDEVERRWPAVKSLRVVHRLGVVAVGEASLWVEIVSPHRGEAFASCLWLIDEMKRVVPIWKHPVPVTAAPPPPT